ncbi:MAG: hypothetical protein ACPGN3_01750 [Opitutales bacterium]
MQAIEKITNRVALASNTIVGLMQTGDRIRQAVEHIQSGLESIDPRSLDPKLRKLIAPKKRQKTGQSLAILKLQAAQLEYISDDLLSARDGIVSQFSELHLCMQELSERISLSESTEDNSLSPEKLVNQLTEVDHLIEEISEELTHSNDIREDSVRNIGAILTQVDAIEETGFDMQVNALNAVINASQIGESGASLAVLAEETMRLSQVMDTSIGKVLDEAKSLQSDVSTTEESTDFGESRAAFSKVRNNLSSSSAQCAEKRASIESGMMKLNKVITNARPQLESLEHLVQEMDAIKSKITDYLKPWESFFGTEWIASYLSMDTSQYTMEHERVVHQQVANLANQVHENTKTAPPPQDEGEIEMFSESDEVDIGFPKGDDTPAKNTSPASQNASHEDIELFDSGDDIELFDNDDGIELFEGESNKSEAPTSESAKKTSFEDDGIELFDDDDGIELFDDEQANSAEESTRPHD